MCYKYETLVNIQIKSMWYAFRLAEGLQKYRVTIDTGISGYYRFRRTEETEESLSSG